MKKLITLILSFSVASSFAQTTDELIEKLLVVSNAEAQFEELQKAIISSYGDDLSDDLIPIIKKYCTWENWKESQISVIRELYSDSDLQFCIQLYEDKKLQELNERRVELALLTRRANEEWVKKIQPLISDDIQKLPPTPVDELESYAEYWNSWSDKQKWMYVDGYKAGCTGTINVFDEETEVEESDVEQVREMLELKTYTIKLCRAVTEFYNDPLMQKLHTYPPSILWIQNSREMTSMKN